MKNFIPVTVAYGDGIGPEIMEAVLYILKEADVRIKWQIIEIGEKIYQKGYSSGIADDAWQIINSSKILLKAPITTPQGGGYKSLNVTLRKILGLYANIRPVISYYPFIKTLHPKMDLTIIRENEEDLYAGIEYRHTANMYQSIKLISQTGSEKIIRYAFDYAQQNKAGKVTCFSKDNIMKFTDGIFHKIFDKIAAEYSSIENEHYIIDAGSAKLAVRPQDFNVIVTSNLYGDIISDIAAEISGSIGLAGSGNIGEHHAMFEAVHGSAPRLAGLGIANPSGLLKAAIMMLVHIKENEAANMIENAWKRTLEDGFHTADIYSEEFSSSKLNTMDFAKEIVKRFGLLPLTFNKATYGTGDIQDNNIVPKISKINITDYDLIEQVSKELSGVDIFIDMKTMNVQEVADKLKEIETENLSLQTISSKGLKLWPNNINNSFFSDHWCCRFIRKNEKLQLKHSDILLILNKFIEKEIDFVSVQMLFEFGSNKGYSLAQGQ